MQVADTTGAGDAYLAGGCSTGVAWCFLLGSAGCALQVGFEFERFAMHHAFWLAVFYIATSFPPPVLQASSSTCCSAAGWTPWWPILAR